MFEFHMSNPYALKFFFNYFPLLKHEDIYIFTLNDTNIYYTIEITHNSVSYLIEENMVKYRIVLRYRDKHVQNISIYGSRYIINENLWDQTDDLYIISYFDEFYIQVLLQLQNYFYTINSKCDEIIDDFQDSYWIYCRLKLFEQNCTPKTARYLQVYRKKLKLKQYFRKWTKFINQIILKRKFEIWKEWYFDPINQHGYIKRLRKIYE
jgi:hypothetical protein